MNHNDVFFFGAGRFGGLTMMRALAGISQVGESDLAFLQTMAALEHLRALVRNCQLFHNILQSMPISANLANYRSQIVVLVSLKGLVSGAIPKHSDSLLSKQHSQAFKIQQFKEVKQDRMTSTLMKLGIASVISAGALFCHHHLGKSAPSQPDESKPIQQIIKEVHMRISTKDNMAIVNNMSTLDIPQGDKLMAPYDYTFKTGGKRIRLIMSVIVTQMLVGSQAEGKIPKQTIQVGGLIELLHSASLIIDDIEDGSLQRRGQPCSHLVYGLDRSINAANLMYFLPFHKLLSTIEDPRKQLEVMKIFIEEMSVSHMGQAQDIMVHKCKSAEQLPTLQEYELLTIAKTSSLLRMMVKMLCVLLNRSKQQSEKLCEVMNYVGLAFQVTDDVLNLTKNLGKGELAEDLKEKKFTPIINYMRDNAEFMNLFIIENKDDETIKKMLQLITSSNALTETKALAEKYEQIAENLIKDIETKHSKSSFQKLMKFIITREN